MPNKTKIPNSSHKQSTDIHTHKILIVDFGSQYTQLIARRIREIGVYCEIFYSSCNEAEIKAFAPSGIILSGGPQTVTKENSLRIPTHIFNCGVPILGICYGLQAMVEQLGGKVENTNQREFGYAQVRSHGHSRLLKTIKDKLSPEGYSLLNVWMSHGDKVTILPDGFKIIASTDSTPIAGIADESRHLYGLQFHPEVTHTTQGKHILARFVLDICACATLWIPNNIISENIVQIRKQVGSDQVILGLSGGVDSSVVAAILHRAIGKQLICVFVDTGLLRLHEGDQVMATFAQNMGVKVLRVNAQQDYLQSLKGINDPEQKRKIIGELFIKIFDREAAKFTDVKWLAQGTIYPDVIESGATKNGKTHLIKSHHNVGALPKNMQLKLLEPLRKLFKDEVRKIGLELGLSAEMINRHPFPGPGLGVRILGEVNQKFADLLRQADAIFIEELQQQQLYDKISQAFAVFLPIKSVGVMGDGRRYDYVIALRAIETVDFMTARWAYLPYDFLDQVSRRIINEVQGISRVTYDISGKPPATIEWE